MELDLAIANSIIAPAFKLAAERRLAPLSVCVLDAGGHLVSVQKQDVASLMRFEIAQGKAYAALGVSRSTPMTS